MKIGINASFVRKPDAGMGRVSANFLQKLAETRVKSPSLKRGKQKLKVESSNFQFPNKEVEFFVYLEEDIDWDLPENFHKRVFQPPYHRDDLIRKIWWEKFLLPKKVKKDGCDVFLSLYQCPTVFKGVPHIMLVHDAIWKIFPNYINNSRKRLYYKKVEKAIGKADKVMTISESSKKDIQKFFGRKEKDIIVNPIDCDPVFKKSLDQETKEKVLNGFELESGGYIFYVGGFDTRKNVEGLLRAYGMLWRKYSGKMKIPKLAIAGKFNPGLVPLITDLPGEIEQVCQEFSAPKENFIQLGFVEQADLPTLYQEAKAFCFPSLYEGFGLPVLEAFNSGCPAVVSENSSLGEIANRQNAFIFENGSDEDLAEKLYECLKKDKKRKEKTEKARKDAEKYSWEGFVENSLKELTSVK
ncbi:MAG: glycosyltransferase family 1 protein [Candidatus Moranbacteria bacterium]|nr:glycosyltransferase family 1 protein [Candidatus Moranbacteria bacterium]